MVFGGFEKTAVRFRGGVCVKCGMAWGVLPKSITKERLLVRRQIRDGKGGYPGYVDYTCY
jgi:hypothetical protein